MADEPEPKRNKRPPTLREIADLTGVHVSTVSRVLRQPEPPDGWSDSAQQIRRFAAELGYRPNLMAASLRTRRSMTLGVVMSRLDDGVMATAYKGLEEAATAAGYHILLSGAADTVEAQASSIDLLLSRQIDGLMLASTHRNEPPVLDSANASIPPVLLFNRHADLDLFPAITCNDRQGGRLAAKHLLELGHRDVGIIAGPLHASTAHDRVLGFCEYMAEFEIIIPKHRIVHSDFEVSGGLAAGRALLDPPQGETRPTAIFAVNDTAAIAAMSIARNLGLSLPRDLSVIGYNDIPLASCMTLPLTTIRSPAENMGRLALQAMLQLIAGNSANSQILPVEMIKRASTAPRP